MNKDLSLIEKIFELGDTSQYTYFLDRLSHIEKSLKIYPEDPIPETPPNSSLQALLVRQLALGVNGLDRWKKAQWQNYWLRCCRSSKCDYIFTLLSDYIDREKDIETLCKKDNALWEYTEFGSSGERGRRAHINLNLRFFLRRYAIIKALKLWWGSGKDVGNLLNLTLPRVWGSTIVGFLLYTEQTMWRFVMSLEERLYWIASLSLIFLSFLYMLYECLRIIEKKDIKKIIMRPICITIYGLICSLIISHIGISLMKNFYLESGKMVTLLHPTFFFSASSLFIGILFQVFWEEKTFTEAI